MSHPGLTGKEIEQILLDSFVPLRWYTRKEAIEIVEKSGRITDDDRRIIDSGEPQFHRRTSNALRNLARLSNVLERNEINPGFWQYRIPE
ncbi:MAG: hypothetical protein HOE69_07515 [Euryarchaeota archaeon]|nr:hypothetical protein [Euryarchaeota archaeon]